MTLLTRRVIMIMDFKCKETEKLFNLEFSRKFPFEIQRRVIRKLRLINRAFDIIDLYLPKSNHLEKLSGDREEQYSIRINKQWRICFNWRNGDAYDVEIVDYH